MVACAGGAPRPVARKLDRARALFLRASRARRGSAATVLRQALLMLDRVDQARYRDAGRGTITPGCSTAITRVVRRVQAGAARWRADAAF
jgi:hypothetical protein